MAVTIILAALALVSFGLTLWQWLAARRFPLHRRVAGASFAPAVTLLKPLKGCDSETEQCLRSWFQQDYLGPVQLLFGVASMQDPVCAIVRRLMAAFPKADAELVACPKQLGPNAKVSTLAHLESRARHDVLVISDADVWASPDLLVNIVAPLEQPDIGLVNCFYRLGNPATAAMEWETVAINADFWSQVLQAQSIKPLDFALGAAMATSRSLLQKIGGFIGLRDYLADDYHLGHKIAELGLRITLSPVVVECRSDPMGWRAVWIHQLRWARTIRVCQPKPYFLSILSNATLWPMLWFALDWSALSLGVAAVLWTVRIVSAQSLQRRLTGRNPGWKGGAMVLVKDLAAVAIWAMAFVGNEIEWRGHRYRMLRDGRLEELRGAGLRPAG